jgi:TRAP-type uncharacterized transport system substrate-binding protein
MDSSSISLSDNATTSSSSFLTTIIEYIAIFVIVYFFYSRGVLNSMLTFFGFESAIITKESFQSLFTDDILKTRNELVLHSPQDYPIYKLGTASKDTYPVEFGSFMHKRIYPMTTEITGGSMDNINLLIAGKLDVAIVDEDLLLDYLSLSSSRTRNRTRNITNDEVSKIVGIAVLYEQPFLLISAQDRNIGNWEDIEGKVIGVLGKSSNSYYHYMKLLAITNLSSLVNTKIYEEQEQMFSDFLNNKLDAFYITTNQKNKALLELSRNIKLRFISPIDFNKKLIDSSSTDNSTAYKDLLKKQFKLTIPKTVDLNYFYSSINTASYLNTIASRMILICLRDLPNEHVNYMVRNIVKELKSLQININQYLYDMKLNNVVTDAFIFDALASMTKEVDIHEGAKDYYKEVGLIRVEDSKTIVKQKLVV